MRDQAIYNLYPNVVSIIDYTDIQDAEGNSVIIDEAAVTVEASKLSALNSVQGQIRKLEASIDTSRIRREVFEGVRKKLEGLSPTTDELWSINKVQDVDNQIAVLRSKLA